MEYSKDLVDISCKMAASSLGYTSVKDEQLKVVSSFLAGNEILLHCLLDMGKVFVMLGFLVYLTVTATQ